MDIKAKVLEIQTMGVNDLNYFDRILRGSNIDSKGFKTLKQALIDRRKTLINIVSPEAVCSEIKND